MMQSDYDLVIAQVYEHLGLQHLDDSRRTGLLNVGGCNVQLSFEYEIASDFIEARLELGPAAEHQREWVWYRMLLSNYEWGARGTLCWSLAPGEDCAVLTAQHAFDMHTTGAELVNWLRQVKACGLAHWQALPSRQDLLELPSPAVLHQRLRPVSREFDGWGPLMEAFCEHAGLPASADLIHGAETLRVDGVDMLLRHDSTTPGHFEVRIDMGMDAVVPRAQLWRGLLWNNFLSGAAGHAAFSVHPRRDVVVLALQQDIPKEVDALELADLLRAMAGCAKEFWKEIRATIKQFESAMAAPRNQLTMPQHPSV